MNYELNKENIDERIGKQVNKYRKSRNLTQEQLAEKLKVSVNFITLLENGKTGVKLETLIKLSDALYVTPNDLLQDFISSYRPNGYQQHILNLISKMNERDQRIVKRMTESILEEKENYDI